MTQQMMTHTTDTYDALVALARSLRPRWDTPGIRTAIRAALTRQPQPTLAELAYAIVRCAENPTIATPAVIALDGPHWAKSVPEADARPMPNRLCVKCCQWHPTNRPCPETSWMNRRPDTEELRQLSNEARAAVVAARNKAAEERERNPPPFICVACQRAEHVRCENVRFSLNVCKCREHDAPDRQSSKPTTTEPKENLL